MARCSGRSRFWLIAIAAFTCSPSSLAWGQETADYFRQNCFSCHTIGGGRLAGPDLMNVTERQDRAWLVAFILDPASKLDDKSDAYAQKLLQEAGGNRMQKAFGITPDRANRLLDLIEAESKLPKGESQFAGMKIPDRPFTPEDVALGQKYFTGLKRFAKGAPSCISCHSVGAMGGLGGGRLGPDLTDQEQAPTVRQGRKTLASWLAAPATPTMLPIYKRHPLENDEILALVAYLEDAARQPRRTESVAQINFVLLGLGGVLAALVVFESIWKGRFRSARKTLVQEAVAKNHKKVVTKEKIPV